jgi:hypothetical protein
MLVKIGLQFSLNITKETSDAGTVYNFDTIDVDGKPESMFKCLKRLVPVAAEYQNITKRCG